MPDQPKTTGINKPYPYYCYVHKLNNTISAQIPIKKNAYTKTLGLHTKLFTQPCPYCTIAIEFPQSPGEQRTFSLIAADLEIVFDQANLLTNNHLFCQQVQLSANSKLVPLPLSLFEGQPVREPVDELKHDWQHLLSYPS